MSDKLTESNIVECQRKFNLSYHVSFAYLCQVLVGFEGKDVLEVGGSLPKEFVFEYLKVNSWSAMETPDYENALKEVGGLSHQGTIIYDINNCSNFGFKNRQLSEYNFFLENIENLPPEYYNKYDLIFSIAAFEHIHKFPVALEKMFLALKPGGKVFSIFSPIWSARDGHHLPMITDSKGKSFNFSNSPIPPWGHLLLRPPQLSNYLYQLTDKQTANQIVYYVYNSPHINRFFTEDYIEFINQSLFAIHKIELTFHCQIDRETQANLEKLHPGRTHFTNNGMLVILEKTNESNNQELILYHPNKFNLILFPDFQKSERIVYEELSRVVQTILHHPDKSKMNLLISIGEVSQEEAELILSDVFMNLLMQEDLEVNEEPEISLLGKLNEGQWSDLLPQIQGRITLENENYQVATIRVENLPSFEPAQLADLRFSQESKVEVDYE